MLVTEYLGYSVTSHMFYPRKGGIRWITMI
nr:MAG TPA: hypothetical protein [Caudoviricetes sp.]